MSVGNNRLAVYVFWEKNGIVRDYVVKYLEGLKEIAQKVVVVANGGMNKDGINKLEKTLHITVIERENVGVDFWAYKTALDLEGSQIEKYDEIILCNCSCYGPVYPFSEMFEEMSGRDVDFWGITEWPYGGFGYNTTWILSYFMVFRRKIVSSNSWGDYWRNLCPVYSRDECIEKHETQFTSYFAERGFRYDVYCKTTKNYIDPTIEAADMLVIQQRCPLIKRKAFCCEYGRMIAITRGQHTRNLFNYLKESGLYDTNIILDDLLATQHYAYIKDCMQLNYILSSKAITLPLAKTPKVLVCFHMYYPDLIDMCFSYLQSVPEFADILITTPVAALVDTIKQKITEYQIPNVSVKIINSRGRAESAFLVATKDIILNYDYACILHDKKSSFLNPGCIGEEFGFHNQDALLFSKEYVMNILGTFEREERLGILEPVNLMYASFQELYGAEWGANYAGVQDILERARITVPIAPEVQPVAPMGAMFWFRPIALKRLIECDWEYEDFPAEPLPLDGSLIHFIERAYPYFAQSEGYLTAWVSSDVDAQSHITNLAYLYRNAKQMIREQVAAAAPQSDPPIPHPWYKATIAYQIMKRILPQPIKSFVKKCYRYARRVFARK